MTESVECGNLTALVATSCDHSVNQSPNHPPYPPSVARNRSAVPHRSLRGLSLPISLLSHGAHATLARRVPPAVEVACRCEEEGWRTLLPDLSCNPAGLVAALFALAGGCGPPAPPCTTAELAGARGRFWSDAARAGANRRWAIPRWAACSRIAARLLVW